MTASYYIPSMPLVDRSTDTATLAMDAMEFVRTVGIQPWSPAIQSVTFRPERRQHATGQSARFGQFVENVPEDLPASAPWRLVSGSFLLDATSWSTDASAAWMQRMTARGGAA